MKAYDESKEDLGKVTGQFKLATFPGLDYLNVNSMSSVPIRQEIPPEGIEEIIAVFKKHPGPTFP